MAEMTDAQRKAFEAMKARVEAEQKKVEETPKAQIRTAARPRQSSTRMSPLRAMAVAESAKR